MKAEFHKNRLLSLLPGLLLLLFYITDGITKIVDRQLAMNFGIAKYTKMTVMLIIVVCLWRFWKKSVWLLLAMGIYIVGQFTITDGFDSQVNITFAKYLFPIILFFFFEKNKVERDTAQTSLRFLEVLLAFNSLLIFLGFILDFSGFHSYKYGGRFGFNALFLNSGTSTYAYIIGLFCLLYRYKEKFVLKPSVYIIAIATVFLGTKGALIGLLSISVAYFMFFSKLSLKQKKYILTAFCIISSVLFYIFFFRTGIFNEIREEKGLLTSVLSLRNDLITDRMLPFIRNEWDWVNYLFGGYNDVDSRSQMGFLDVFYFWGIMGGIFYLVFYFKIFVIRTHNHFYLWTLFTLAFIIFLAGNFFENPSLAIFLLILKQTFQYYNSETLLDEP